MKPHNTFWKHITPIRMMQRHVEHTIKVTHLGGGIYGCRVFLNGILNAENRCRGKAHIGAACRDLLRWESKLGNWSDYADSSRSRGGRKQAARTNKH